MRSVIQSFFWVLPFLAFLAGYQLLRSLSHVEIVEVPPLVGLHMHDAIKILSSHQLNVRILAEKEDPDIQEGIIVSQTPLPLQRVKPHQSIFVVITRKPPQPKAPTLYGLSQDQAQLKTQEAGLTLKCSLLESTYPQGSIIAQGVQPGDEVDDKSIHAYCSSGTTSLRIVPDLKGKRVDEVISFFKQYSIKVDVKHPDAELGHSCSSCTIRDQRPFAGTLIDLKKPFSIAVTAGMPNEF